jgi:hypothetical protein
MLYFKGLYDDVFKVVKCSGSEMLERIGGVFYTCAMKNLGL